MGHEQGDGASQSVERAGKQRPVENKRNRGEDRTKGRNMGYAGELRQSKEGTGAEVTGRRTLFSISKEDGDALAGGEMQDVEGLKDKHGGSPPDHGLPGTALEDSYHHCEDGAAGLSMAGSLQKGGDGEAGRSFEGGKKDLRAGDFSAIKRIRFKFAGGKGGNPGKSAGEGGIFGASKGLSDEESSSGSERLSGSKSSSDGLPDSGILRKCTKPRNREESKKINRESSSGSQCLRDGATSNVDGEESGAESSSNGGASDHESPIGRTASTFDTGMGKLTHMTSLRKDKRGVERRKSAKGSEGKSSPVGVEDKGKHESEQPSRTTGNHHRDPGDRLRALLRETKRQGRRQVNLLGRYDHKVEIARIFGEVADDCSAPLELRAQFPRPAAGAC
jgi:hypothetical protein